MTSFAKIASVLLFSGLAVAHGAVPASSGNAALRNVEPLKGITLTVGSKRAVGYFVSNNNVCTLTLMLADKFYEGADPTSEPVRFNTSVPAGTSTLVETVAGHSLAFSCESGATSMTVQPVERLAYVAPAK